MPVLLDGGAVQAAKVLEPALSTLDKTVIGALLVVSWVIAIAAIVVLVRTQNSRVSDQKEASAKLSTTHDKMVEGFGKFKGTVEELKNAEQTSQQVLSGLKDQVLVLGNKIDMLIMHRGQRGGS